MQLQVLQLIMLEEVEVEYIVVQQEQLLRVEQAVQENLYQQLILITEQLTEVVGVEVQADKEPVLM